MMDPLARNCFSLPKLDTKILNGTSRHISSTPFAARASFRVNTDGFGSIGMSPSTLADALTKNWLNGSTIVFSTTRTTFLVRGGGSFRPQYSLLVGPSLSFFFFSLALSSCSSAEASGLRKWFRIGITRVEGEWFLRRQGFHVRVG